MELWPFLCDYAAAAEDAEQLGSLKGANHSPVAEQLCLEREQSKGW